MTLDGATGPALISSPFLALPATVLVWEVPDATSFIAWSMSRLVYFYFFFHPWFVLFFSSRLRCALLGIMPLFLCFSFLHFLWFVFSPHPRRHLRALGFMIMTKSSGCDCGPFSSGSQN